MLHILYVYGAYIIFIWCIYYIFWCTHNVLIRTLYLFGANIILFCTDISLSLTYILFIFAWTFSGVTRSLVSYVCFVDRCLSFCAFSLNHFVLSCSDYPLGIFKLFCKHYYYLVRALYYLVYKKIIYLCSHNIYFLRILFQLGVFCAHMISVWLATYIILLAHQVYLMHILHYLVCAFYYLVSAL